MDILDRFQKNTQLSGFIKVRLAGVELLHASRQSGGTNRKDSWTNIDNSCFTPFHKRVEYEFIKLNILYPLVDYLKYPQNKHAKYKSNEVRKAKKRTIR